MDVDFSKLQPILERYKAEIPGKDDAEREEFITAFGRLTSRTKDDLKAATTMAADVVKSLVQAGLAAIVATGAFVRWVWNASEYWEWAVFLLGIAASLFFANSWVGSRTLARIYRRVEGRDDPDRIPWGTEPHSPRFQTQAVIVALGLLFFAAGVVVSVIGPETTSSQQ